MALPPPIFIQEMPPPNNKKEGGKVGKGGVSVFPSYPLAKNYIFFINFEMKLYVMSLLLQYQTDLFYQSNVIIESTGAWLHMPPPRK